MRVQIARWGNSLGLRLPKALAAHIGVEAGASVDIAADGGCLVIRPARPRWTLDQLLENMTPQAARGAFDWGDDVGRERIEP